MRPALFVHCLSFSDRSIISRFIPIWPSTISNIFNMDDDNQYLHWNRFWTVLICNILSMRTLLKTLACNSIFWLKYSICFIQLFLGWLVECQRQWAQPTIPASDRLKSHCSHSQLVQQPASWYSIRYLHPVIVMYSNMVSLNVFVSSNQNLRNPWSDSFNWLNSQGWYYTHNLMSLSS